jgi:S-adenosylmethionine decarboxylase
MIVGFEWIIDAGGCNPEALRDVEKLQAVFAAVVSDLQLKTIGAGVWHKFGGEGGVTGLVMLTESHLACHTYPEHNSATFNLYCCRQRPEWNWDANLREMLAAKEVTIKIVERGTAQSELRITNYELRIGKDQSPNTETQPANPKSAIQNPKSIGGATA